MKKLTIIIIFLLTFSAPLKADTDGDNSLSKSNNKSVNECFESLNRGVFAFNKFMDNTLIEPIAKGYRKLPTPIKSGTGNVLNNLSNLVTIPNNLLQGNPKLALDNTARLLINSTVGILGIFDPASKFGFEINDKEDYGQTLATWGVGEGCYVMLPILGPSTARDAISSMASFMGGDPWYNVTVRNDTHYVQDFEYYASKGATGVDFRAKNIESFDNLESNSVDFYASVKSLFLQDRKQKISNSDKITNTMDDSDWEEIETQ